MIGYLVHRYLCAPAWLLAGFRWDPERKAWVDRYG